MTFEEYLKDIHMDENPTILDDDLPDHFDNWLSQLTDAELRVHQNMFKARQDYLNK